MAVSSFTGSTAVVLENTWKYVVSQCFSMFLMAQPQPHWTLRDTPSILSSNPFCVRCHPLPTDAFLRRNGRWLLRAAAGWGQCDSPHGEGRQGQWPRHSRKSWEVPSCPSCQMLSGGGAPWAWRLLWGESPLGLSTLAASSYTIFGSKYGSWANTTSWCYTVLHGVTWCYLVLSLDIILCQHGPLNEDHPRFWARGAAHSHDHLRELCRMLKDPAAGPVKGRVPSDAFGEDSLNIIVTSSKSSNHETT